MTLISTLNSAGRTLFLAAQWLKRDTQAVAAIEAAITTPVSGVIERFAIAGTAQVEAGDLLAVIRPGE